MTKIKVSREVADAIELLRSVGASDYQIIADAWDGDKWANEKLNEARLALKRSMSIFDYTVLKALANGYEVEETPEEKVAKYYKRLDHIVPHHAGPFMKQAVEELAEIIELEIDGIPRSKRSRNSENFRKEYGLEGVNA